jgi:carbamoyltransferase
MAGGVALNSVANAKIPAECGFDEVYVVPAAGDDGGCIGAALWACHHILGIKRAGPLGHAYLGTEYYDAEIREFLDKNASATRTSDDERFFERVAATSPREGGRLVPRPLRVRPARPRLPLHHRDSRSLKMKELVNAKIKFREAFRPFAPSVLSERAAEYFEMPEATAPTGPRASCSTSCPSRPTSAT